MCLGRWGSRDQSFRSIPPYFGTFIKIKTTNRGLKRVSINTTTKDNRANDVSRNPSKFQGITRPWFQTTKMGRAVVWFLAGGQSDAA